MKRLIIQSGDEAVEKFVELSRPIHEQYALACGADYHYQPGRTDPNAHPAWNRFIMAFDAFVQGYEQVLWLDTDTLVVDHNVNVFERAPFDHEGSRRLHAGQGDGPPWEYAPFVMRRTAGGAYWPSDGDDQWEQYNDGVLLMNRSAACEDALEWLWGQRTRLPQPHHVSSMWELNWLLDLVKERPEMVVEMDQRFNWQPFNGASPEQYAVILAWHGIPHQARFSQFRQAFRNRYAR